jgi:PAS domain S-box-containing protein
MNRHDSYFSEHLEELKEKEKRKFMTNKKLFFIFVISFMSIGLISTYILSDYLKKMALDNLAQKNAQKTSELVFETLYSKMQSGWNKDDIYKITARLNHMNPGSEIKIYRSPLVEDLFGIIEADRAAIKNDVSLQKAMKGETLFLPDEVKNGVRYVYPMKVAQECLYCHVNSKIGDINGVIDMFLPAEDIQIPLNNIMRYFLIFVTIGTVLVFVIFQYMTRRIFINPITRFTEAIESTMVNTEFNEYINCSPRTHEINVLEVAFNQLLFKVNGMLTDIRNKNKLLEEYKKAIDDSTIVTKTDKNGIIIYANQQFCTISGYEEEELIGKNHNIVRSPNMPKEAFKELWETIQSKKTWNGIVENRKKNGDSYFVKATVMPILDTDNEIVEYIAVRQDISELVRLNLTLEEKVKEEALKIVAQERILLQRNKLAAMGEMLNGIAHNWKQPLNALGMTIQNIEVSHIVGELNDASIKDAVKDCMRLIMQMGQTINDFSMFISNDKQEKSFDLKNTLQESLDIMSPELASMNIGFSLQADDADDLNIKSHEGELKQIVFSFINNAKDALADKMVKNPEFDGGHIQIELSKKNESFEITICDNAGGIPQDIMHRIFEPYFTTKEQGKGVGLGLYMGKLIIEEQLYGKLKVENINEGARFSITLPLAL